MLIQLIDKVKGLFYTFIYIIFVLLIIGLFIWFGGKVFSEISNLGKFEGLTAKEWYDEYDAVFSEKMTCEENYNALIDEQPSEELLELDNCIKNAISSSVNLLKAADKNPNFTPKQKTQLLFTLADLTTKEKRECTETYLSK